ncbi:MAG TPA: hypothetical protein GYA07_02320 [Verrucomicrobia bacterium]|nr:hypothetical protein [Verrucomicrobiota bacterium]HOP96004.1 hypothetical protein [Verrucomicrobiota bacterium]HPU56770.1 hypothetical protein [Verrucomicrobiota bacterium]
MPSPPDYFAVFEETPRPWLDPERLRQKFLDLSAAVHPDRVHQLDSPERAKAHERYVLLNVAYQCLSRHRDRVRHLLELESGERPEEISRVPAELVNLFMEIGRELREAEKLHLEKTKTTSPLLQVQLFERAQKQVERLQQLRDTLRTLNEKAEADLRLADREWTEATAGADRKALLPPLRELQHRLGYLDKWEAQLHQRILELSI